MPANTSPDNIQFPTAGDQIAPLNTVFQNLANTVQTALSKRPYRWANAAARTAQAGMLQGELGYQVDAAIEYQYVGTTWIEISPSLRYFQGAQTLANNAATDLQSNGSRGGFGSAVTDGSNALIIARAGWYDISGTLNFATNSTGARTLEVTVDAANLSPRLAVSFGAVGSATMTVSGVRFLAANAVVRISGFQSSGGTLSTGHSLSVKFIRGGTAPA